MLNTPYINDTLQQKQQRNVGIDAAAVMGQPDIHQCEIRRVATNRPNRLLDLESGNLINPPVPGALH